MNLRPVTLAVLACASMLASCARSRERPSPGSSAFTGTAPSTSANRTHGSNTSLPERPAEVSFIQLIAVPEKWYGKAVRVTGYLTHDGRSFGWDAEHGDPRSVIAVYGVGCPPLDDLSTKVAATVIRWSEFRPHASGVRATLEGIFQDMDGGEWGEGGMLCPLTDIRLYDAEFNHLDRERILRNERRVESTTDAEPSASSTDTTAAPRTSPPPRSTAHPAGSGR